MIVLCLLARSDWMNDRALHLALLEQLSVGRRAEPEGYVTLMHGGTGLGTDARAEQMALRLGWFVLPMGPPADCATVRFRRMIDVARNLKDCGHLVYGVVAGDVETTKEATGIPWRRC